jgi:ATP-dependent HslUV protease ATP-binding subunit HslU
MAVEGVSVVFDREGVAEIARLAAEINRTVENIGARRLHTVIERIMEDISYSAPEMKGQTVVVDKALVRKKLGPMLERTDLSKFIL